MMIIAELLFSHLEVIFKDDSGLLLFSQWSPTVLVYSRRKEQFLSFNALSLETLSTVGIGYGVGVLAFELQPKSYVGLGWSLTFSEPQLPLF